MPTWNTRGLRGSVLEDFINITIEKYRENNLALIQKIPTPIKPINIDKDTRHITLAYFDQKSTVDYIGVVQGIPVCFDAKECNKDVFALSNIHEHQYNFMKEFEKQSGVAFILLYYTHVEKAYYVPFRQIDLFMNRIKDGHAKNFKINELDEAYSITKSAGVPLHFLKALQKDLDNR